MEQDSLPPYRDAVEGVLPSSCQNEWLSFNSVGKIKALQDSLVMKADPCALVMLPLIGNLQGSIIYGGSTEKFCTPTGIPPISVISIITYKMNGILLIDYHGRCTTKLDQFPFIDVWMVAGMQLDRFDATCYEHISGC